MKLTPSRRVYGLGAILLTSLLSVPAISAGWAIPASFFHLAVAGLAYLLAIREFFSRPKFPRHVVVVGLVLGRALASSFSLDAARPDDDIHRYLWDGRLQRLGYDPYLVVPSDPAFSGLHTSETRTLNNPDVPSPYPAGAELFFRVVTTIHESTFALKVAFVLCDFAIVLVLLDILRRSRQGMHWVLAYAWHPLLATEVAGSGHIDILGALLLLVSFAALGRRWRSLAAVAFGLAVAVKLLPVVLLPLYWKRVRLPDGVLAIIVVGLLYVPFLKRGSNPLGSLGTYVQNFRFNDPVFATLERVASPQVVAGLAVLVGFLIAIRLRMGSPGLSSDAFVWPMAGSLLCAPVVYPWYLLWMLPFLRSTSTLPIIIWTVSIIPTYLVWHLRTLGCPWSVPGWVTLLEYGSVATAGAIILLRRLTRPPVPLWPKGRSGLTCTARPRDSCISCCSR